MSDCYSFLILNMKKTANLNERLLQIISFIALCGDLTDCLLLIHEAHGFSTVLFHIIDNTLVSYSDLISVLPDV